MLKKKLWLPILIVLLATIGWILFYGQKAPKQASTKIHKPVGVEKPTEPAKAEAPVEKTTPQGHVHDDGTFHAEPHESPAQTPRQYTAPPGAATKPDFPSIDPNEDPVEAAYKRLEYIKNNPYAWGGVHSERATELIAELMPPTVANNHNEDERRLGRIEELIAQNDPRAGEVLLTNMCEAIFIYAPAVDALEQIGPPAMPYILHYLEKGVAEGGTMSIVIFEALADIGLRYRSDLGGIVDHIIIPKLEVIAADGTFEHYGSGTVLDARAALAKLQ